MAKFRGRKSPETAGPGKDDLLALALAQGKTQAEAAKEAGIHERTVRRKLADPAFKALVAEHRRRMAEQAYGVLSRAASKAFRQLDALIDDHNPKVALMAARTIGRLLVSVGSYTELADRLAALEQRSPPLKIHQ